MKALTEGARYNDDGHGFALIYPDSDGNDQIAVGHGMDGPSVIRRFARLRAAYPDSPALFHSRIGTAGRSATVNCHPFFLGDSSNTVLAHNGILPTRCQPAKGDARSDTGILAEDYLPGHSVFSRFDDVRARRQFEKWLSGDKVIILTTDPQYLEQSYLFGEDLGYWDNGVWYSNSSYRPWKSQYTTSNSPYAYGNSGSWSRPWSDTASASTTGKVKSIGETLPTGETFPEGDGTYWVKNERGIWEHFAEGSTEPIPDGETDSALTAPNYTYSLCGPCGQYGVRNGEFFCEFCLSCTSCAFSIEGVDREPTCQCRSVAELDADYQRCLDEWDRLEGKKLSSDDVVTAAVTAAATLAPAPAVTVLALPPGASPTPSTVPTFAEGVTTDAG